MKEQDKNSAWGFSLFADDLRDETGGKVSLMGIFQADMVFPDNISLPITVSKFVVLIMYYETFGKLEGNVTFRVTYGRNEEALLEAVIERKHLTSTDVTTQSPSEADRISHIRIPVVISPFQIKEFGRMRVRAHYEDGSILKLGSLNIQQMPAAKFNELRSGLPQS